jgi:hypothetical protein
MIHCVRNWGPYAPAKDGPENCVDIAKLPHEQISHSRAEISGTTLHPPTPELHLPTNRNPAVTPGAINSE